MTVLDSKVNFYIHFRKENVITVWKLKEWVIESSTCLIYKILSFIEGYQKCENVKNSMRVAFLYHFQVQRIYL